MARCLAILLLLTAPAARAPDTVHGVMQQAKADFELARALELWQGVLADDSLTKGERFAANLRAGHLARVLERDDQARLHYLYVLRRSPTFQLPVETGPKIRSFFELVRQEVAVPDATGGAAPDTGTADEEETGASPWLMPAGLALSGAGLAGMIAGGVLLSMGTAESYLADSTTDADSRQTHADQATGWYLSAALALPLGLAALVGGIAMTTLALSAPEG